MAQAAPSAPTASRNSMRGLENFIASIRRAPTKEREGEKVRKELAKIRKKFTVKNVNGYNRRKYMAKLLYLNMLGYDIDFGLKEALVLMNATKFQEKLMGYLAAGLTLYKSPAHVPEMVSAIKRDLNGENEYVRGLALNAVANILTAETAPKLLDAVGKVLTNKQVKSSAIKKKACAACLQLYRSNRDLCPAETWAPRLKAVLEQSDVGVLSAGLSLAIEVVRDSGGVGFESLRESGVKVIKKMILERDYTRDYIYKNIACPWVQVKAMQLLQLFDPLPAGTPQRKELTEVMRKMLNSADVAKGQTWNHKNALNAVLFEAINLVIHNDNEKSHTNVAIQLLGRYLSNKYANVRYLALVGLRRLASLETATSDMALSYEKVLLRSSLYDPDVSIRQRTLDVLFQLCNVINARRIVNALVRLLEQPGAASTFELREELVLKIAILSEKFCEGRFDWYITVMLRVMEIAGDFVSDPVWFRVVAVVTNYPGVQSLAVELAWDAMVRTGHLALGVRETLVKVTTVFLGEFGHMIASRPDSTARKQFDMLQETLYPHVTSFSRALILTAMVKMAHHHPELLQPVLDTLVEASTVVDVEIQQRACEYIQLLGGTKGHPGLRSDLSRSLLAEVLKSMPSYASLAGEHSRFMSSAARVAAASIDVAPRGSKDLHPAVAAVATSNDMIGSLLDLSEDNTGAADVGASPAPDTSKDNDDLMALFSAPAQPAGGASAALAPEPLSDILGLGGAPAGNGAAALFDEAPAAAPSSQDQTDEALDKLALADQGVLFQDDLVQIAFKAEYKDQFGRVMLFVGNQGSEALQNVSLNVDAGSSQISWTVGADPALGSQIDAGVQARQLLLFQADGAGGASLADGDINGGVPVDPRMLLGGEVRISYTARGSNFSRRLILPIHICKFMSELKLDGPKFFQKWKEFESTDSQGVFKSRGGAIDLTAAKETLREGLKLTVLAGVDPNANNLVLAATVQTGSTGACDVCVRLESNAQAAMYRCTVRAADRNVANAVLHVVARHVGQPA